MYLGSHCDANKDKSWITVENMSFLKTVFHLSVHDSVWYEFVFRSVSYSVMCVYAGQVRWSQDYFKIHLLGSNHISYIYTFAVE